MNPVVAIAARELRSYFATPIAYVFVVIFLAMSGVFTFFLPPNPFYETGQADLTPFFYYHPWLYLFLVPALSMRLWAEERKTGSIELLMTLPLDVWQAVLGKFLAAWIFIAIAIALTFPIWITVNYLGDPDNGTIFAAYIGSVLMAGGFLAVGSCVSAATKNQVIALIVSVVACFVLLAAGSPLVVDPISAVTPQWFVDAVASLSFLTHFSYMMRGVIDVRDLVFFALLIGACLYANTIVLHLKKAD